MHPRCGVLDVGVVYGDIYGVGARLNEMVESGLFFMVRYSQVLSIMPFAICYLLCRQPCGCLFGFVHKKKPTYLERFIREESSQRAPPYFVDGGSIN